MSGKQLLIFLLVFLFGFSNATPTFPVGEKTVKNDWFQCFETTSAGEIIVKECMAGSVGCFVEITQHDVENFKISEVRGCAFDDKPFSKENMKFVCKFPRCNSPEKMPINGTFLSCYVSNNQSGFQLEICPTNAVGCFVKTTKDSWEKPVYWTNRGCLLDDEPFDEETMISCKSLECNSAKLYPPSTLSCVARGYSLRDGDPQFPEAQPCANNAVGCYIKIEKFKGSYKYSKERNCIDYRPKLNMKYVLHFCEVSNCNSWEKYKYLEVVQVCVTNVNDDGKNSYGLTACEKNGCYVKTSKTPEGEKYYLEERGCLNDNLTKMKNVMICEASACNSVENYPPLDLINPDVHSCLKNFGNDLVLVNCPKEFCAIGITQVENGKNMYTDHRDCAFEEKTLSENSSVITCSGQGCNSAKNYPINETFFTCFDNDTLIKCQKSDVGCFVSLVKSGDPTQFFYHERGCADKDEEFSEENMRFICHSSGCNSHDKFGDKQEALSCYVSDKENTTQLCKIDAVGCYVDVELSEGNYTYSTGRGCAYVDEPFSDKNLRITCNSPHCNSLEKYEPTNEVFSCFAFDESGGLFSQVCNYPQCYVKTMEFKSDEKNFLIERGCADESHEKMKNAMICETPNCNSLENYPVVDLQANDTFICSKKSGDYNTFVKCSKETVGCYVERSSVTEDGKYFYSKERGCVDHPFSSNTKICYSSFCNSLEKFPLNQSIFSCFDSGDSTRFEYCDFHAVGCYVEVSKTEDGNYTFTDNRGCAYVDEPFSDKNLRITCKSPRCNSVERYEPTENAFLCHHSDEKGGNLYLEPCENDVCFIKNGFFINHLMFEYKRGCAHEKLRNLYYCKTSKCNSFENFPFVAMVGHETCLKTFKDHSFWINCPKLEGKGSCMIGKDDNYYGGYRVDCYENGTELNSCGSDSCVRKLKYKTIRCIIGSKSSGYEEQDCKNQNRDLYRKCLIIYNDDNSIKRRECGIEHEYFEKTFSCSEDLCNSVEKYPDS